MNFFLTTQDNVRRSQLQNHVFLTFLNKLNHAKSKEIIIIILACTNIFQVNWDI